MSGHTNRNRRNGGNSRSRHGPQRQRGPDGRANEPTIQPKNGTPLPTERQSLSDEKNIPKSSGRPTGAPPPTPPAPPTTPPEAGILGKSATSEERAYDDTPAAAAEEQETSAPRGKTPFVPASRAGHAYIPASGQRHGLNGQNGQNGHYIANGRTPVERRTEPPASASEYDDTDGDSTVPIPSTWRTERLNGGVDTTPREVARPESRGEIGPLVDSLHELFAQDRQMASRGDSIRCGICYLHFPLSALEYREAEGFYVCDGCKRALGHHQVMMLRRQQTQQGG